MRSRSASWERIAKRGQFNFQAKATINGTDYFAITAPRISRALLSKPAEVGNCNAATLSVSVRTENEIPSGYPIVIKGRVVDQTGTASEWLEFGTFYIDQRNDEYKGLIEFSCYDAMLKCNQAYPLSRASDTWPKSMSAVVSDIASLLGIAVDPRTTINTGSAYVVPQPTDLNVMQVLGYIGACHGGNWIITEENKLRLVPLVSAPEESYYIVDTDYDRIITDDDQFLISEQWEHASAGNSALNAMPSRLSAVLGSLHTAAAITVTGIHGEDGSGNTYFVGDQTGYVLNLGKNPYLSQAIINDLLTRYQGLTYVPFKAESAIFDPAMELGDQIMLGSVIGSMVASLDLTLDIAFRANLSAPNDTKLQSEYPYASEMQLMEQRLASLARSLQSTVSTLTELNSRVGQLESRT